MRDIPSNRPTIAPPRLGRFKCCESHNLSKRRRSDRRGPQGPCAAFAGHAGHMGHLTLEGRRSDRRARGDMLR